MLVKDEIKAVMKDQLGFSTLEEYYEWRRDGRKGVDEVYKEELHSGRLGDIAPTILQLMGIDKPLEMTGQSLLRHKTP